MKSFLRLFAFSLLLLPAFAYADAKVFINGVDITGVKNQSFANVNVSLDSNGNVQITSDKYKIVETTPDNNVKPSSSSPAQLVAPPTPEPDTPDTLPNNNNPVFLVAAFNYPGLLGYNIDVYVNGKFVKTITQGDALSTCDISAFTVKGLNTIRYQMIMAADSGTASKALVSLSLAQMTASRGNKKELTGEFAPLTIKGSDGQKSYQKQFIIP